MAQRLAHHGDAQGRDDRHVPRQRQLDKLRRGNIQGCETRQQHGDTLRRSHRAGRTDALHGRRRTVAALPREICLRRRRRAGYVLARRLPESGDGDDRCALLVQRPVRVLQVRREPPHHLLLQGREEEDWHGGCLRRRRPALRFGHHRVLSERRPDWRGYDRGYGEADKERRLLRPLRSQAERPAKGICIRTITYTDGSKASRKIVK